MTIEFTSPLQVLVVVAIVLYLVWVFVHFIRHYR